MTTPIELKKEFFDELVNACTALKVQAADGEDIDSKDTATLVDVLNKIFEDKNCKDFIFTNNTDNLFFGVYVDPTITNVDLVNILVETEEMELSRYMVEIDSKLVNILDANEIAAYLVEEISNIMYPGAITNLRAYIDSLLMNEDESIDLKNSLNYNGVLIFAFKDTLRKITSILYKLNDSDHVGINRYATEFDTHDALVTTIEKIRFNISEVETNQDYKDLTELKWAFLVYKNMSTEFKDALSTIDNAKRLTGSKLQKHELDKVYRNITRAASENLSESTMLFEARKQSIFAGIKKDGLRSIEEAIYEYKVRIRNCRDADEALYILRCINANIIILENYIDYTPGLSDSEKERWKLDIDAYRELREEIARKKFNKATFYGIDYSRYDNLDNNPTNTPNSAYPYY